jgi:divalent metal cation (Fe/Co/Zn/Cd) transporter
MGHIKAQWLASLLVALLVGAVAAFAWLRAADRPDSPRRDSASSTEARAALSSSPVSF